MPVEKQIFVKDFTKEWVEYAILLASIAIAKEEFFGIAIAKLSVNGPLEKMFCSLQKCTVQRLTREQ